MTVGYIHVHVCPLDLCCVHKSFPYTCIYINIGYRLWVIKYGKAKKKKKKRTRISKTQSILQLLTTECHEVRSWTEFGTRLCTQ